MRKWCSRSRGGRFGYTWDRHMNICVYAYEYSVEEGNITPLDVPRALVP